MIFISSQKIYNPIHNNETRLELIQFDFGNLKKYELTKLIRLIKNQKYYKTCSYQPHMLYICVPESSYHN